MTRIPIACTLTVDDALDRVDEWRRFFSTHTTASDLRSPTELAVTLADGEEALLAAVDLAQREQTCCGFFGFSIAVTATSRSLVVTVPDDAAGVLADFATLARA